MDSLVQIKTAREDIVALLCSMLHLLLFPPYFFFFLQGHAPHHCAPHCVTMATRRRSLPAVVTLWSFREGQSEKIMCV